MARSRFGSMMPYLLGGGLLYLMMSKSGEATLPQAGEPTEYWIDPTTFRLWYEWGGVTQAPQPGMRPASSFEISTYWPPVNHPEFGSASTVMYGF